MWRLLALTFAVAHGDLLTEDSDHDIHVFQKHSWPTSLRSNMLGNALSKTLHVHGNLDVEGKLVHGDTTLNITNLALKSEIPNITNLALKTQIPDITNLALKTQIPNITNLVNKTYVDEKIAAISTGDASIKIGSTVLTEQNVKDLLALDHGDTTLNITNLALKSEIPNITNLALKTQIPDITNLALKTQIPNITNLVNKTYVDEKIAAISTGDASIKIGSTVLTEQNVKDLLALDLAKLATLLNITDIIENS